VKTLIFKIKGSVRTIVLMMLGLLAIASGCGMPSQPQPTPPGVPVAAFYLPRSTTYKYWYLHKDYAASGVTDSSIYILTYLTYNPSELTADGLTGVDVFTTSDSNGQNQVPLRTFVGDSVIEYGSNDTSLDYKIVRLADSLKGTWVAATQYKAPDGLSVKIDAYVVLPMLVSLGVTTKQTYSNVYQVNYTRHAPPSEQHPAFQDGAVETIYYAQGFGKILATCNDPNGNLLWEDRLINITQRP